jgi:hypothetical protein
MLSFAPVTAFLFIFTSPPVRLSVGVGSSLTVALATPVRRRPVDGYRPTSTAAVLFTKSTCLLLLTPAIPSSQSRTPVCSGVRSLVFLGDSACSCIWTPGVRAGPAILPCCRESALFVFFSLCGVLVLRFERRFRSGGRLRDGQHYSGLAWDRRIFFEGSWRGRRRDFGDVAKAVGVSCAFRSCPLLISRQHLFF